MLGALVLWRHFIFFKTPWAKVATQRNDLAYIDTVYKRWAPGWRGPERDASLERIKAAFRDPTVLDGAIDYYRAISPQIDRRLAGALTCRGLMVAGGNDFGGHIGPYKKSLGLLDVGSDLLVVPAAGHWPHREAEALFTDRLLGFLAELP